MKKRNFIIIFLVLITCLCVGCFDSSTSISNEREKLELLNYELSFDSVGYNGEYQYPNIKIKKGGIILEDLKGENSTEDLDVVFSDNLEVGRAKIVISARTDSKKYMGSKTLYFNIEANSCKCRNLVEIKDDLAKGIYKYITLIEDNIIDKGVELIINENTNLNLNGHELINNGKIIQNGTVVLDEKESKISKIINNGEYILNNNVAKLNRSGDGTIFINKNIMKIENENIVGVHNEHSYIFNDATLLNIEGEPIKSPQIFDRFPLSSFNIDIKGKDNIYYSGKLQRPLIKLTKNEYVLDNNDIELNYFDNINAGTAKIEITAKDYSKHCFGSMSCNFDIKRAEKTFYNRYDLDLVQQYLNDENYANIIVNMQLNGDFTIPKGMQLTLLGNYFHSSHIINNGKLIIEGNNQLQHFDKYDVVIENNGEIIINARDIANNCTLIKDGNIINNGKISINQGAIIDNHAKISNGNIVNNGEIYLASEASFNNVNLKNIGEVYYNDSNQIGSLICEKNTPKKRINFNIEENLKILNNDIIYDGKFHNYEYDFYVNKERIEIENCYLVIGGDGIKDAGVYDFGFKFNNVSKVFYGEDITIFTIKPASIVVYDLDGFLSAIESKNYNEFTIDFDCDLNNGYGPVKLNESQTMIIPKNRTFINGCTLGGDLGKYGSYLNVNGKIINNGTYIENDGLNVNLGYYEDGSSKGVFINNEGAIAYFNKVTEKNKQRCDGYEYMYPKVNTGTVYIRSDASTTKAIGLPTSIEDSVSFGYNNEIVRDFPEIIISTFDNVQLVNKDNDINNYDYLLSKPWVDTTSIYMPLGEGHVFMEASKNSKYIYGKYTFDYNVLPGKIDIGNIYQFYRIFDTKHYIPIGIFKTINIVGDIIMNNEYFIPQLKIESGMVFTNLQNKKVHLGRQVVDNIFENTYTTEYCDIINNGTIKFKIDNVDKIDIAVNYYNSTGVIQGYANTEQEFDALSTICDEVYLNSDKTFNNINIFPKYGYGNYRNNHKVYLEGCSIKNINIDCTYCHIEIFGQRKGNENKINVNLIKIKGNYYPHTSHDDQFVTLHDMTIEEIIYNESLDKGNTVLCNSIVIKDNYPKKENRYLDI